MKGTTVSRGLVILLAAVLLAAAGGYAQETRDLAKYPVRFAIIGDRTGDEVPDIYPQIVAEIERLKPEFVMTVGDMIEGYTEDVATLDREWQEYFDVLKPLSMPVYFTPGNHDITTDGQLDSYRKWTNLEPYYSFDYDGIHMVVLDNSRINFTREFAGKQLEWLVDDLEKHQDAAFTFVFFHKPLWYRTLSDNEPDTLHSILAKHEVDAVFSGHWHRYFTGEYDGIKYVSVGTSGGRTYDVPGDPGYHFMWVTVSDDIAIAPIKMNAVLPWDDVSVEYVRYSETVRRLGIVFVDNAPVLEPSLAVDKAMIHVDIINPHDTLSVDDTVSWTIPEGWSVEPAMHKVTVAPGGTERIAFEVTSTGSLYPLPSLRVNFPYEVGVEFPAESELRVCRKARCALANEPPAVDGRIDEAIWQEPFGGLLEQDGTAANVDSAAFYFAYDSRNVYFSAHCIENKMDSLCGKLTEHDAAIYGEDCVGFLYRPGGTSGPIYQLYVNPLGTTFDQEITQNSDGYWDGDQSWDGVYEIATRKGDGFWDVEIQIPLSQFDSPVTSGESWDFNFRRKQRRLDAAGGWQVPHTYDPNSFGKLVME